MNARRRTRHAGFLGALILMAAAVGFGASLAARADSGHPAGGSVWRDGAAGYRQAAAEAAQQGLPMLIYFRTDWCPYCREFERELLSSAEVEGYLIKLARARINPEAGKDEENLAAIYGVSGYPGTFPPTRRGGSPAAHLALRPRPRRRAALEDAPGVRFHPPGSRREPLSGALESRQGNETVRQVARQGAVTARLFVARCCSRSSHRPLRVRTPSSCATGGASRAPCGPASPNAATRLRLASLVGDSLDRSVGWRGRTAARPLYCRGSGLPARRQRALWEVSRYQCRCGDAGYE